MEISRLFPSGVTPPMPCVENQYINSVPSFLIAKLVEFQNPTISLVFNVHQKGIPHKHH